MLTNLMNHQKKSIRLIVSKFMPVQINKKINFLPIKPTFEKSSPNFFPTFYNHSSKQ